MIKLINQSKNLLFTLYTFNIFLDAFALWFPEKKKNLLNDRRFDKNILRKIAGSINKSINQSISILRKVIQLLDQSINISHLTPFLSHSSLFYSITYITTERRHYIDPVNQQAIHKFLTLFITKNISFYSNYLSSFCFKLHTK